MKTCNKCGERIKLKVVIDGKERNLQHRKYCLTCSPFGLHNTTPLVEGRKKTKRQLNSKTMRFRRKLKYRLVQYKGGKCQKCGYAGPYLGAYAFHHRDPSQKSFGIGAGHMGNSWQRLVEEADKCDLLCVRCHAETHEEPYIPA